MHMVLTMINIKLIEENKKKSAKHIPEVRESKSLYFQSDKFLAKSICPIQCFANDHNIKIQKYYNYSST